jgi:ABC transporter substrate binding protein
MRRREFITLLGGAATWPLAAHAQQTKVPLIGFLSSFSQTQSARPIAEFRRGLSENGFTDGQNVTMELSYADGQYDRLPALADGLVRRPVDLIFAAAPPAALAAKAATTSIPVVFVVGFDPVAAGLVASLSRPGGNVTGMTLFSNPLAQKRLEILLELAPRATEVAMLVNPVSPDTKPEVGAVQEMAQQRGLRLRIVNAASLQQIDTAVATLSEKRPDARAQRILPKNRVGQNRRASPVGDHSSQGSPVIPAAGFTRHVASHDGKLIADFCEIESGKRSDRPQLAAAISACRTCGRPRRWNLFTSGHRGAFSAKR